MANVYAVKSGDWSDTSVWNTGSLPASTDSVYAGGYEVTIDQDIEALLISSSDNVGTPNEFGNGNFSLRKSGTTTIEADIYPVLIIKTQVGNSAQINITGNVYGGDDSSYSGHKAPAGLGIAIIGADEGGSDDVYLNIDGDVFSGYANIGIYSMGIVDPGVSIFVTGNVESLGMPAIGMGVANTIVIDGEAIGFDSITGNAISASSGDIIIKGKIESGGSIPAVLCSIDTSDAPILNYARLIITGTTELITAPDGVPPFIAYKWFITQGATIELPVYEVFDGTYDQTSGPAQILTNAQSQGSGDNDPAEYDVRKGVQYGDSKTGTLAVPDPLEVAFGIPTDNTTGRAAINLARLSEITGNQIASAFDIIN